MTNDEVQKRIWLNTGSNYVALAVRLATGLVLFRMLIQYLSAEEFGFWVILWSVFGYGILLDFGFGFTAQKRVAELSVHQNWTRLSQVLSTIFFCYVGVAAVFVVAGFFGAGTVAGFFAVTPENQGQFTELLVLCFCGLGLAFPLGLFPEVLRGQQRIALANYIMCVGMVANFGVTVAAIHLDWGLKAIFIIALLSTYIPDLLCGFLAFRKLPNVKIRLRFFSRQMIRDTMSFSFYAYLITISHVILAKTDQLIIGAAVAVSAVVLYQVGAKLAEVFGGLAHQLPETFSPAAAHLHARGDKAFLRQLLLDGTRFTVMIATPLYIICAFYMEGLVKLLMNEKEVAPEQFWIAQVLLLWTYMVIVTQSVSKRIFVMCGHERRLMFLTVGETVLNLALSIGLVLYFRQVIWVAVGSLTASIIFGWFFLWPWSAREANLSGVGLARAVLVPTALACLPVVAVIVLAQTVPLLDFRQHVALMAAQAAVALVVAAISLWFVALKEVEREKLLLFFARFKGGRAA